MKILIIIADDTQNQAIQQIFKENIWDIIAINNYINADQLTKVFQPDIIILDYQISNYIFYDFINSLNKLKINISNIYILLNEYEKVSDISPDQFNNQKFYFFSKPLELIQLKKSIDIIINNNAINYYNYEYEKIFKMIWQHSNDAIFFVDYQSCKYIYANNAALRMTGLSLEQIREKHTYDISPDGLNAKSKYDKVIETIEVGEVTYIRPDGTQTTTLLSVIPIQNNFVVGIAKDITERKNYETKIKESEKTFKKLINDITDLIYIQNYDGEILEVNQAVIDIYGYHKEEIINKDFRFLAAEEFNDFEEISKKISLVKQGKSSSFEFFAKKKNGSIFLKEVLISPGNYFNENIIIAVSRDITEKKSTENLLKQTLARNTAIINAIPDIIIIIDGNYKIIDFSVNDNSKLLMTPNKFLNKNIYEVFPQELIDITKRNIDKVLSTNSQSKEEYSLYINKELNYFEARYIKSSENEVLAIIRDITEQRHLESTLNDQRYLISSIVDNAPFEVWARDINLICILENKKLKEHWGSILGKTPQLTNIKDEEMAIWMGNNERALNGEIVDTEVYYDINGQMIAYRNIIAPIYDDKNQIKGIVGYNIDISKSKEVEKELIKQKEKATESDKLKTAFLRNITHEVRTPLNSIIGFSNLLNQDDLTDNDIKSYTEIIKQSGNKLIDIINNIIDISKIQTKQIILEEKVFSLNTLIEELYSFYINKANEKEIEFRYNNNLSDEHSLIYGDELRISQILNNLLDNAFKFTTNGEISFGYNLREHFIEFFVIDTGIGISTEKQINIFDRFLQLDDSISRQFEGIGLGLSICKDLVELMGGSIWVKSTQYEGSKFYFTIPYKPFIESNNLNDTNIHTVLIVENEPLSYKYLKTLLDRKNVKIIHAEKAQDVLFYTLNYPNIDLIFIDYKLTRVDKMDIIKEVKKQIPNIKIIVQSSNKLYNNNINILAELGCDEYITKPIDLELLDDILSKYL